MIQSVSSSQFELVRRICSQFDGWQHDIRTTQSVCTYIDLQWSKHHLSSPKEINYIIYSFYSDQASGHLYLSAILNSSKRIHEITKINLLNSYFIKSLKKNILYPQNITGLIGEEKTSCRVAIFCQSLIKNPEKMMSSVTMDLVNDIEKPEKKKLSLYNYKIMQWFVCNCIVTCLIYISNILTVTFEMLWGSTSTKIFSEKGFEERVFQVYKWWSYAVCSINRSTTNEEKAHILYAIGLAYSKCIGISGNIKKGIEYWEQAAKMGSRAAMYHLGFIYYHGIGISGNIKKGIEYWEQAAELGSCNALYRLGFICYHGIRIPQNSKKGIEYWERAADLGNRQAMYRLGLLYVDMSILQAVGIGIEYWEQAADLGSREAMYQLGSLYKYCGTTPEHREIGIQYYEQADKLVSKVSELGSQIALFNLRPGLGKLYLCN